MIDRMDLKDVKRIYAIIDEFDFEKVHKAMVALDWQWANKGIPEIREMKETAFDLLCRLFDGCSLAATGGFVATKSVSGELTLQFVLSESSELF